MNPITLEDIVKFVLANRRGKVFKNWSELEIACHVHRCMKSKTVAIVTADENNDIIGVATALLLNCYTMHIDNILTIKRGLIPFFIRILRINYPEVTKIQGVRKFKNNIVHYDINKLAKAI